MRALLGCIVVCSVCFGCGSVATEPDAGPADANSTDGNTSPDAMEKDPCDPPIAAEDFWGCLTAGACELVDNCACLFSDVETCTEAEIFILGDFPVQIAAPFYADSLARGAVTYDAAKAAACMDFIANVECRTLFGQSDGPFDEMCNPYSGQVGDGQQCFDDLECATPGAACIRGGCTGQQECCAGTCTAPAAVGQDCSTNFLCEPGSYCVPQPTAGNRCENGQGGALCNGSSKCDPGFWCNGSNFCEAKVVSGAACTVDDQCPIGETCVGEALMTPNGHCARVDRVDDACDTECFGCMFCQGASPMALGACKPLPELNGDCSVSGQCAGLFELTCNDTSGLCEARGAPAGSQCTDTDECAYPLFCSNDVTQQAMGSCLEPQPDQTTCNAGSQCASRICDDTLGACRALESCE